MICCAIAAPTGLAQESPSASAPVDWTRFVPDDARVYVEIRDLAGIRRIFRRLGIWDPVRRLSEPPETVATSQPWHRNAERALGLTPERAISLVLGRRAALFARDPGSWQSGVLLAELPRRTNLDVLLRRWRASQIGTTGPVRRYRLRGGILLAVRDRTLLFGPPRDPDELWERSALLLSGGRGPTLRDRSEFAGLRSRLTTQRSGFGYASFDAADDGTAGRPAESRRFLVGFEIDSSSLTGELHSQEQGAVSREPLRRIQTLIPQPPDTIAAWASSFDFGELEITSADRRDGPDVSLARLFLVFLNSLDDEATGAIGPRYGIILSSDARETEKRFLLPRVGVVLEARSADKLAENLVPMIQLFATIIDGAAGGGDRPPSTIRVETYEGTTIRSVEIGARISASGPLSFLAGVEFCWAGVADRLVLSTSRAQLRSIVRSAGNASPDRAATDTLLLFPGGPNGPAVVEAGFARGRHVAGMLSSWLDFIRRDHPAAIEAEPWRRWAAGRLKKRGRLGVGLRDDRSAPGRAVVAEIGPVSAAAGLLKVGDIVTAAGGAELPPDSPAATVARRYEDRRPGADFTMTVLRNGQRREIRIRAPAGPVDLGGFDPPGVVRQLALFLRPVESLSVRRYASAPGSSRARLEVRWRRP